MGEGYLPSDQIDSVVISPFVHLEFTQSPNFAFDLQPLSAHGN
jgi:hypothetical protein